MRMRIPGVDLEATQLLLAERPVLQHAGYRVPEGIGWVLDDHVLVGALAKAARVAGVARVHLVGRLLAGHPDALEVDHDDVVTGVQVRRVHRLVLAAQHFWGACGEPPPGLPPGLRELPARPGIPWGWAVRVFLVGARPGYP